MKQSNKFNMAKTDLYDQYKANDKIKSDVSYLNSCIIMNSLLL